MVCCKIDRAEINFFKCTLCMLSTTVSLTKKQCACKDVSFIKCSWCEQTLCFTCFYDKYHPNNCNPECVGSENE